MSMDIITVATYNIVLLILRIFQDIILHKDHSHCAIQWLQELVTKP